MFNEGSQDAIAVATMTPSRVRLPELCSISGKVEGSSGRKQALGLVTYHLMHTVHESLRGEGSLQGLNEKVKDRPNINTLHNTYLHFVPNVTSGLV